MREKSTFKEERQSSRFGSPVVPRGANSTADLFRVGRTVAQAGCPHRSKCLPARRAVFGLLWQLRRAGMLNDSTRGNPVRIDQKVKGRAYCSTLCVLTIVSLRGSVVSGSPFRAVASWRFRGAAGAWQAGAAGSQSAQPQACLGFHRNKGRPPT